MLTEAFAAIGEEIAIVRLPSERSLHAAVSGDVDGEFARIGGIELTEPTLRRVDEPLVEFEFSAFTLRPELEADSWQDLADLHVGYIDGWKLLENRIRRYRSTTRVADEASLFRILLSDRVDLVIYSRRRGEHFLANRGLDGVRTLSPPLAIRSMYLYLHARHEALVEPLEQQLRWMRETGRIAELQEAWLNQRGPQ